MNAGHRRFSKKFESCKVGYVAVVLNSCSHAHAVSAVLLLLNADIGVVRAFPIAHNHQS